MLCLVAARSALQLPPPATPYSCPQQSADSVSVYTCQADPTRAPRLRDSDHQEEHLGLYRPSRETPKSRIGSDWGPRVRCPGSLQPHSALFCCAPPPERPEGGCFEDASELGLLHSDSPSEAVQFRGFWGSIMRDSTWMELAILPQELTLCSLTHTWAWGWGLLQP